MSVKIHDCPQLSIAFAAPAAPYYILHYVMLLQTSLVVYHTTALPSPEADWLGNPYYVHQLNTAGMSVAEQHGVDIIDIEGMLFGLPLHKYLRDKHHPNSMVSRCTSSRSRCMAVEAAFLVFQSMMGTPSGGSNTV